MSTRRANRPPSVSSGQSTDDVSGYEPERFRLQQYVPYKISMLAGQMRAAHAAEINRRFHIGVPEWRVIMAIAEFAPVTSKSIAEYTTTAKADISRAVGKLVKDEIVLRTPEHFDRRNILLSLTSKGEELHRRLKEFAVNWERELLSPLSANERETLVSILDRLQNHISEELTMNRAGFAGGSNS